MKPTSRTFNYRDAAIEVEFSLPVNRDTVLSGFRVTPPMEGSLSWPSPTKVVFTPRALWDQGGTYLVTLSAGITDESGAEQLEATSWDFSTVGGYFYSRDIRPLVTAQCAACHSASGPAARVRLDSYAEVMRFVQPGNAERSPLVVALSDGNHQEKLPPETAKKLYVLRDWISVFNALE